MVRIQDWNIAWTVGEEPTCIIRSIERDYPQREGALLEKVGKKLDYIANNQRLLAIH